MDLKPSTTYAQYNAKRGTRMAPSQATRPHRAPAGAVRRSQIPSKSRNFHPATVAVAALLFLSAVVWATNESKSLVSTVEPTQTPLPVAETKPDIYFDDARDALGSTGKIHRDEQIKTVASKFRSTVNQEAHAIASIIKETVAGETEADSPIANRDQSDDVADAVAPIIRDFRDDKPVSNENVGTDPAGNVTVAFAEKRSSPNVKSTDTPHLSDNQALAGGSLPKQAEDSAKTQTKLSAHFSDKPEFSDAVPATSLDGNSQNFPDAYLVTVSAGDTLSGILNDNGLSLDQLQTLLQDKTVKNDLTDISVDQVFSIARDNNGNFKSLTTRVSDDLKINITLSDGGFDVQSVELPIKTERVIASGSIEQSLFLAAEKADIKQSTIMELANVFQWDLDFERDIRKGDRFSLIYDKQYREGEYIGDGDILAAEFVRGSKSHRAIRVEKDDGTASYYSPDGQSKRRTFMRHPVDVVRITSKFNPNRLHPVLHQIRAHRGVDYGSPHGSPIYATADGKVIHSGAKGAYGKTVILKHGEKFSTLYAHMSKVSNKSKVGSRVKQGDVIGYVGKTGRVTGTHLHYEFRVYGEQIDPLEVKLPAAQPLAEKYLPQLKQLTEDFSELMGSPVVPSKEHVVSSNVLQGNVR